MAEGREYVPESEAQETNELMQFLDEMYGAENIIEMIEALPKSSYLDWSILHGDIENLKTDECRQELEVIAGWSDDIKYSSTIIKKSGADKFEKLIKKRIQAKELARVVLEYLDSH